MQGAGLRFCVCYRVLCCCLFVFATGCCVVVFLCLLQGVVCCLFTFLSLLQGVVVLSFCVFLSFFNTYCYRVLCYCLFVFVIGCQGAGGVSLERQHTTHFTGWSPVGGSTPPSNHLFGTSAIFSSMRYHLQKPTPL